MAPAAAALNLNSPALEDSVEDGQQVGLPPLEEPESVRVAIDGALAGELVGLGQLAREDPFEEVALDRFPPRMPAYAALRLMPHKPRFPRGSAWTGGEIIGNPGVLKYTLVGRNSRKKIPLDVGFPTRPAVEDMS